MPSTPVIAGTSFSAGLLTAFLQTYELKKKPHRLLPDIMQLGIQATRRQEKYFYWTSVPKFVRWGYGDSVSVSTFEGVQFSVNTVRWGKKVEWNIDDEKDDQTSSLRSHVQGLAARAAMIDERVAIQLLEAGSNLDLLENVPNAPDGAAGYSTTDGDSADRFGVTNGNSISLVNSVTNPQDALQTYFDVLEQFGQFQDTEGEPLWDEDFVSAGIVIVVPMAQLQVWMEAFKQYRQVRGITFSGTDIGGAQTNPVQDLGWTVEIWATSRISSGAYFFMQNADVKAIFRQEREPISAKQYTLGNSDKAGDEDVEGVRFKFRAGYAWALPIATIKAS